MVFIMEKLAWQHLQMFDEYEENEKKIFITIPVDISFFIEVPFKVHSSV